MPQENKDLLLKDLCARLLYGIKFPMMCWDEETGETVKPVTLYSINKDGYCHVSEDDYSPHIDEIKPYLFPLSSMTEEQKEEYEETLVYHDHVPGGWTIAKSFDNEYIIPYWFVDFCNKHHFDYRGLIPKGLAIDATGLNIY